MQTTRPHPPARRHHLADLEQLPTPSLQPATPARACSVAQATPLRAAAALASLVPSSKRSPPEAYLDRRQRLPLLHLADCSGARRLRLQRAAVPDCLVRRTRVLSRTLAGQDCLARPRLSPSSSSSLVACSDRQRTTPSSSRADYLDPRHRSLPVDCSARPLPHSQRREVDCSARLQPSHQHNHLAVCLGQQPSLRSSKIACLVAHRRMRSARSQHSPAACSALRRLPSNSRLACSARPPSSNHPCSRRRRRSRLHPRDKISRAACWRSRTLGMTTAQIAASSTTSTTLWIQGRLKHMGGQQARRTSRSGQELCGTTRIHKSKCSTPRRC